MSYNGSNEENSIGGDSVKDHEGCQGESKINFLGPRKSIKYKLSLSGRSEISCGNSISQVPLKDSSSNQ